MLPENDVVDDAELESTELLEGRLGQVEPLAVRAAVAVVHNRDGNLVAVVHQGDLVTALEGRVRANGGDEVIVAGGRTAAGGLGHHVARVVGNTAVTTTAGSELGRGSESNANESKENGQEKSSTHFDCYLKEEGRALPAA